MFENLLMLAVRRQYVKTVRALLALAPRIDVNAILGDAHRRTALHEAVFTENDRLVRMLVEAGADPNLKDNYGFTPLCYTIQYERTLYLARILIEAGGQVNCKNLQGQTALHLAAKTNNRSFVASLLRRGADIEARDDANCTPLHHAVENNEERSHYETISTLLYHGANVDAFDRDGITPLLRLAMSRYTHPDIVELVFELKPHVHVRTPDGEPMILAARSKNFPVLQKLIEHGCDVNVKGPCGTPLHEACAKFDRRMVKCLVRSGADVNARDHLGRTSLEIALTYKHDEESYEVQRRNIEYLLKYTDVNAVEKLLASAKLSTPGTWKIIIEHIVKLQAFKLPVNPAFLETISKVDEYKEYFDECHAEVNLAKSVSISSIDPPHITFFDILKDDKRSLMYYAHREFLHDVELFEREFPIFGATMRENMIRGIKRRLLLENVVPFVQKKYPFLELFHIIEALNYLDNKELLQMGGMNCLVKSLGQKIRIIK